MSDVDKLKAGLTAKPKLQIDPKNLLSLGYTPLDLALSGHVRGGLAKGQCLFAVGDSGAGKTWLGRSILARAAINKQFDGYKLVHDDAENGAAMDTNFFFGEGLAERIQPPSGTQEEPVYSRYVEEFYYYLDDLFELGKPFIYVLDSENALKSKKDEEQFQEEKIAHEKGKEAGGDYGTHKAKAHSRYLGTVVHKLRDTGSCLIILGQTRQRIGIGASFNPSTYSGGKALRFYAHSMIWMAIREDIKRTVNGKQRIIGINTKVKVDKNRLTGWEGTVEMPIYRTFGIDNVGGSVSYLLEEGHWKKGNNGIHVPEWEVTFKEEKLIQYIEENGLERDLRDIVGDVWAEVEAKCAVKRKNPYT